MHVSSVPVRNTVASSTAYAKMDRPTGMLCLTKGMEFSKNRAINKYLTLRLLCENYRDAGGKGWVGNGTVPELDGSIEEGQMCRLRGFNNVVGYPYDGLMMAWGMQEYDNVKDMISALAPAVATASGIGMLWCPPGLCTYRRVEDQWVCNDALLTVEQSEILTDIQDSIEPPLSAYSCHAFYEAQRIQDSSPLREVFTYGSQVTPVAGVLGTLHNNTAIDVHVDEDPEVPSIEARTFKDYFKGILCAGHTAHSQDAGIARRVTMGCNVGIMKDRCTLILYQVFCACLEAKPDDHRDWWVFCMGAMCRITEAQAESIWRGHVRYSKDANNKISMYYIWWRRILVIGISSGIIRKEMANGRWMDSTEVHGNARPNWESKPVLDETGSGQLDCCFSPYFSLIPYIRSDRPPRPLMASVQTQQAVCTPWSPGTAAVSPCYVGRPLVRTPLVNDIISEVGQGPESIADEVPGFMVCMAWANLPPNYEDAMVVSRRFVDMGGFSSTAICAYLLPLGEYVPPSGFTLCSRICRWWKSSCPKYCKHQKPRDGDKPKRVFSTDREPTGVVMSSHITPSGEISVRVLSYAQLQTGDKLSTGHGQKGVTNIIEHEDMPFGVTDEGEVIHFDVIMAISSVVNRQTNGQIYEGVAGLQAIRQGKFTISSDEKPCIDEEVTLFDGCTGARGTTILAGGKHIVSRATWGFTNVFSQTQMVRERHHASHFVPGEMSVVATKGRSRGGPIRLGEMEHQGLVSIGLVSCAKELMARSNMVSCAVCVQCRRLSILCQCTGNPSEVHVTMPYGTLVFDVTCAATEGCSLEYDIVPAE